MAEVNGLPTSLQGPNKLHILHPIYKLTVFPANINERQAVARLRWHLATKQNTDVIPISVPHVTFPAGSAVT